MIWIRNQREQTETPSHRLAKQDGIFRFYKTTRHLNASGSHYADRLSVSVRSCQGLIGTKRYVLRPLSIEEPTRSLPTTAATTAPTALRLALLRMALQPTESFPATASSAEGFGDPSERVVGDERTTAACGVGVRSAGAGKAAGRAGLGRFEALFYG